MSHVILGSVNLHRVCGLVLVFLFLLKVWTKCYLAFGMSLVHGKLSIFFFFIQLLHFCSNDSTHFVVNIVCVLLFCFIYLNTVVLLLRVEAIFRF